MPRIVSSLDATPRDGLRYLAGLAIVIAGLYVGAEIFVPVALAILLSFALAPGVRTLQRARLGRVVPVFAMTLLAFLVISSLGTLLALQIGSLADSLPRDEATVVSKIESLRDLTSGGGLSRFSDFISNLATKLHQKSAEAAPKVPETAAGGGEAKPKAAPLAVTIEQPPELPLEMMARYLAPALHPLLLAGLVAVYAIFMLLQREDLRNRAIRLFGAGDLHNSTAAIDDAARRLSRYLLTQLAINATAGFVAMLGLALIGVPSPILWGIVFGCLRFVPYLGPPLAAVPPVLVAAAIAPGWSLAIEAAVLYAAVETVVGQFVEPYAYGHNTGLSPVAVVVAATFWTVLWGPVGLVLATPITVCLVVLGRHVEPLEFLDVMLGDRPPLAPPEVFYQRMLADDPVEASDQAEKLLKEMTLTDYYDGVLLPALLLAQEDVSQGRLELDRQGRIAASIAEVVENLSDHDDAPEGKGRPSAGSLMERIGSAARRSPNGPEGDGGVIPAPALPEAWRQPGAVLCIGGRGPLDDAAAGALAQLLGKHGLGATAASFEMLTRARLSELDLEAASLVCLSCLDGGSAAFLRFLLRRLTRRGAATPVLIGAWWRQADPPAAAGDPPASRDAMVRRDAAENHDAVSTLAEAVTFALRMAIEDPRPATKAAE